MFATSFQPESLMLLQIFIVLAAVLLVPMVCHKIRVPSVVGFILAGMAVGSYGAGWLEDSGTVAVLGKLGMLYIMFQSGSEIDLNELHVLRRKAGYFGLLSFLFPMLPGVLVAHFIFGMDAYASCLLGAMFGSHTLMTYPIVSRYGVQKTRAVNIAVGGTIVAVTLSLLVLALVKNRVSGADWRLSLLTVPLSLLCVMWLFPKLAQLFLKRYTDPVADFMLVMVMLVLSALLTDKSGLDGILGAFLCGLSLNRLLPGNSSLMRRITFVGNSIFVPLFLISVGMLIDVRLFWSGSTTLVLAAVMIVVKLTGKWMASFVSQKMWGFVALERQLMFGLTHAAAAGTLAVVSIGYESGIFGAEVLSASVLMILVMCTTASFVTEYASKELALQEEARMDTDKEQRWQLLSLGTDEQPLAVLAAMAQLQNAGLSAGETWHSIEQMTERESCSFAVYQERQPLNTVSRLLVAVPRYAEKERDFITCFGLVRRLAAETGAKVIFYSHPDTQTVLRRMCRRPGKTLLASFRELDNWEDVLTIAKDMSTDDMVVLLSSRRSTASYNPLFAEIPQMLERFFGSRNWLVVYPEQQTGGTDIDAFLTELPPASSTWSLVSHIKGLVLRLLRRIQLRR